MKILFDYYESLMPLTEIKDYDKNRNNHPEHQIKQLAFMMAESGVSHPIHLVRMNGEKTNVIAFGHGRKCSAIEAGFTEYPIVYQDFTNWDEVWIRVQSDNAIAIQAEIDFAGINADLPDIGPFNIDLLGIKDFVVEPVEKLEPQGDENHVPELKEDPVTKLGDVWILGNHRIMCGDSTMINDVEKLMNGEKADMVFTDPPYNQNMGGGGSFHKNPGRESLKKLNATESLNNFNPDEFLQVLNTLNVPTNYIFCSKDLIKDYIQDFVNIGRNWNMLIMKKRNPIPQKNNTFLADVEYLFCSRVKGAYWKNDCPFEYYHRVREINVKPSEFGHPTEKQVGYISPYFEISCPASGKILDLFLGSGTTLIAAEKTDRQCYGMELDPRYCDTVINRWQKYTLRKAVLESNGKCYDELKGNCQ